MTDAQLTILVAAIPGTIAALIAAVISWRSSTKVDEVKKEAVENTAITASTAQKTDALVHKSEEIAGKVDGHLSKLTEELSAANAQIKDGVAQQKTLQDLVNQLIQATLTNGKSAHAAPISLTPPRGDDAAIGHLKSIDDSAVVIKDNTARTDAKIEELKDKP